MSKYFVLLLLGFGVLVCSIHSVQSTVQFQQHHYQQNDDDDTQQQQHWQQQHHQQQNDAGHDDDDDDNTQQQQHHHQQRNDAGHEDDATQQQQHHHQQRNDAGDVVDDDDDDDTQQQQHQHQQRNDAGHEDDDDGDTQQQQHHHQQRNDAGHYDDDDDTQQQQYHHQQQQNDASHDDDDDDTKQQQQHQPPCPENCNCDISTDTLRLQCNGRYNSTQLGEYLGSMKHITLLTFTHSRLMIIPRELCLLKGLKNLTLDYNNISIVPDKNLTCLPSLVHLSLNHNVITKLHKYMLQGLSRLEYISIAYNNISDIDTETFLQPELQVLTRVLLNRNSLTVMDAWPFRIPSFVNKKHVGMNFSENNIYKFINTINFTVIEVWPTQAIFLDFTGNQLKHVRNFNFVSLYNVLFWWDAIRVWNCGFLFKYNPFDCDCDMYSLLTYLKPFLKMFVKFQDLEFINVHCHTPPEANGELIYKAPDYIFRCYVNQSCPQTASCIHIPGNQTVTVINHNKSLSQLPDQLPKESHLQLYYPHTQIQFLDFRDYFNNITILDLSWSFLVTITDSAIFALIHIRHLNVQSCQLTSLPEAFANISVSNDTRIDISGNPFVCDCYMTPLKQWIVHEKNILLNTEDILCHNFPLHGICVSSVPDNLFLCYFTSVLVVVAVFLAYFIILAAILLCGTVHKRIELRLLWLFDRNLRFATGSKRENISNDIAVFMAAGDIDDPKVIAIINALKCIPDISLFDMSNALGYNTSRKSEKIHQSRGSVFLLSTNFLDDNNAMFLLDIGIDFFRKFYRNMYLIPVFIENKSSLTSHRRMSSYVRYFLKLFSGIDLSSGLRQEEFRFQVRDLISRQLDSSGDIVTKFLSPAQDESLISTASSSAQMNQGLVQRPTTIVTEVACNDTTLLLPYVPSDSDTE